MLTDHESHDKKASLGHDKKAKNDERSKKNRDKGMNLMLQLREGLNL